MLKAIIFGMLLVLQSSSRPGGSGTQAIAGLPNCTGITGTVTDCFVTPFTPLQPPWLNGGFGFGQVKTDGSGAVPVTGGGKGAATNGAIAWGSDQSSLLVYSSTTGIGTGGLFIRASGSGAYLWEIGAGAIFGISSTSVFTNLGGGCPAATPGDVYKLSAASTTITCLDVTTGVSGSISDPTYTAGRPGFAVDGDMKVTKFGASSP
ncbi:MAG TPA: hypothetical protein VK638_06315 [Edaphobacter sp.]|nr:hypothetical protein [Edaphobacter sp.]